MIKVNDVARLAAMYKVQQLMHDPEAMKQWFLNRVKHFMACLIKI